MSINAYFLKSFVTTGELDLLTAHYIKTGWIIVHLYPRRSGHDASSGCQDLAPKGYCAREKNIDYKSEVFGFLNK